MVAQGKVTDRDLGWKALRARIEVAAGARIKVGVLESAGAHRNAPGLTVAQVAEMNEYGTATIPERPAMRNAIDGGKQVLGAAFARAGGEIIDGVDPRRALSRVGLVGQALVRRSIVAFHTPPNAPSTIAKKGSSHPLIATGQYLGSISFEVLTGAERGT